MNESMIVFSICVLALLGLSLKAFRQRARKRRMSGDQLIASSACTESFFTGALEAFNFDISILDENGRILYVNRAWRELNDATHLYPERFAIDQNYFELPSMVGPEDPEVAQQALNGVRAVMGGQQDSYEQEYERGKVWYLLRVSRYRCDGPVRVVVSHENITDRKVAEQKLRNKQEKLRAIYNCSSDGILLFNTEGLFDCNRKAISMLGAKVVDPLLGQFLWDFAPRVQPDGEISYDVLSGALMKVLSQVHSHSEVRLEFVLQHLDGSTFPVELILSSLKYNNESIVQATVRDISERKQVEERLQEMNRQLKIDLDARIDAENKIHETAAYLDVYRKIVDQHAIVAETDIKGTIVAVNDAFCRISGYTREELVGKNHRILNSGIHPKSMWTEMYKTVAQGGFWHGEICNRTKDGRIYWVDTTIAPLFSDTGKLRGYFAIRADITSLKRAQTLAEAANRSKSQFLANMSHEIRTPMTAILGYAELLSDIEGCSFCDASKRVATAVETIQRNGEHLLAIINDILDISKIEADKMTIESVPTNVGALISDCIAMMQVKAKAKGLRLSTEVATPIPKSIHTDPVRLRQILVNLIGNAIKFTETGSVTVSLRMEPEQPDLMLFEVRDTGIGMTEEQVGRLFQAFEQVDTSTTRRFGGTGLGLRISRRLAQMLGGDIAVTCESGQGCIFTLQVSISEQDSHQLVDSLEQDQPTGGETAQPINKSTSVAADDETPKPEQKQLSGMHILVAEDGPDNQRLITHHLRKAGAIVRLVGNGRLAIEAVTEDGRQESPLISPLPFDLILMDMQMPEMDGYEATRCLRAKGVNVPIYALTAHALDVDLQACLDAGCNLRLTKPIDRNAMIEACQKVAKAIPSPPNQSDTFKPGIGLNHNLEIGNLLMENGWK